MKAVISFIALLLSASFSSAQINPQTPWTWMKGDNTTDQFGIYGTQGVADIANKPGARNSSATWRDANGNLWLFGGTGNASDASGYLNDLWKYTPASNKWTWVNGSATTEQFSNYGSKGIANIANKPGGSYSSVSWTDASGNLWLFGGYGYDNNSFGFLNTLWKYNTSSNEWTWVNGDSTIDKVGVYGTQGISNVINKPGARYGSRTWIDASGNLWLYGGYGFDGTSTGILNDIWKYNPSTNQWTWIKGDNGIDLVGNYGTKGISTSSNNPGARYVSTSWTDANDNLWLFGGYGYDENKSGILNDLWKYNPVTNEWTWVNGEKIVDQQGSYGTVGTFNVSNQPGSRYVSSSWTDASGNLWLFGGYGFDVNNANGYLNDLWKYNPVTNEWAWVKGDNTVDHVGVYGTQGMADPSNKSGARIGSVSWTDGTGSLWLFGGYGFDGNSSGVLNDLWKINNLNTVLPLHLLRFNGVVNNEAVLLQWQTEMETGFSHFNVQRSLDGIHFTTIGIISGSGNSNKTDYTYTDNDLKNQTAEKAFYRLQLMDKDGKFTYSKVLMFDWKQNATTITTFPNPTTSSLTVSFNQKKTEKVTITITDLRGLVVKQQEGIIAAGRTSVTIDVNTLAVATYILSVRNSNGVTQQKFVKQ